MRMDTRPMRWAVWCLASWALGIGGCGGGYDECAPGGCITNASLVVFFDGNVADVLGGETEVCVDAECDQASWAPVPTDASSSQLAALGNGVNVHLVESGVGAVRLVVRLEELAEGQERTIGVRVTNASGATVLDIEQVMTLERYEGCGETCFRGSRTVDLRGMSDAGAEVSGG